MQLGLIGTGRGKRLGMSHDRMATGCVKWVIPNVRFIKEHFISSKKPLGGIRSLRRFEGNN